MAGSGDAGSLYSSTLLTRAWCVLLLASALTIAEGARAQGLTAQIGGVVLDPQRLPADGAAVTITNTATSAIRDTLTNEAGAFLFPDLLAGTYNVIVRRPGFKTFEHLGVVLTATERAMLPPIVLELGGLQDTVTVRNEAVLVQTATAARSAVITRDYLEDYSLKGRDFAGMLKLLPGVIDTSPREAPGWNSMGGLSINGRSGGFNFSYDGVTNKDTGSNLGNYAAPALDSIAEVRVQAANFQAEYGRSSGATITVVTRSGSQEFHASAAFFKRDAALNANEFSRKEQCRLGQGAQCKPPLYKFDNYAWTLGGPLLIPATRFNDGRDKLFFFWSQDLLSRMDPGMLNQRRMPTTLERNGDFSQTFDSTGRLIFIRDPARPGACASAAGGSGCFAENIIPAQRIDPTARALLHLFPLPNATDPTGRNQYNYVYQTVQEWPRNDQVLRVDWNVGPGTTAYGRLQFGYEKRAGGVSLLGSLGGWPQLSTKYEIDTVSYVGTLLHAFSSTLYSEATVGVNWAHQYTSPMDQATLDANDRLKVLPGLPQFFPDANPLRLLPQATFAGGPPGTIGSFGVERRFPYFGFNTLATASASLTAIRGAHNVKAGIFVEHTTRPVQQRSSFNGTVSFNADGSNPLNTNIGFANALLGAITSYQEADAHPIAHGVFRNTEFYVQDNWRLRRRFTLDAGVRFYFITPTRSRGDRVAQFEPGLFDPAAAPLLYQPATTPQGRRAVNPQTGEVLPLVYLARLVQDSGDFSNGLQVYDETPHPRTPFRIAPRAGFAWDVAGNGRTALRGGVGVFYDRYSDNDILELVEVPPLVRTYTTGYTTIAELLASPLTATPAAVRRIEPFVPPVVYNWSAGIQRDMGWHLVTDMAYVGNAARHQLIAREINGRPYGYTLRSASLDPTNVVAGRPQPLPDDLLRPYRGFGSITQREFTGYSDYHSLQLSATRRRSADRLSFGAAYTYELSNKSLGAIDPFVDDNRARNYNSLGRRPHTLTLHYSYELPVPRSLDDNQSVRALLGGWQLSGVTTILSGARGAFTYVYTNVPSGTISGNGSVSGLASRPDIVCDPFLPASQRTFDRQFRTECLSAPGDPLRLGNAHGDEFRGPGYINWDVSIFKHVPIRRAWRLQLRAELYNAFNTNQWTAVNTVAEFDYLTGAVTNGPVFGRLSGATNSARRVQVAARLAF